MKKVNIHEAKSKLSALLAELTKNGQPITICKNGLPIAQLTLINMIKRDPFKQHPKLKKVKFHEDPSTPLSKDDWPEELT